MNQRVVATTKIFGNGETYIPVDIRKKYGIKNGDKVVWYEEDGKIILGKA